MRPRCHTEHAERGRILHGQKYNKSRLYPGRAAGTETQSLPQLNQSCVSQLLFGAGPSARHSLTPARAMAKTNQKMHITRG